jgi:hypothetical protein
MLPIGKAKLYWLIELYTSGHHDVGTFCKEFERAYNFEIDKSELSADEQAAFADLFEKATLYSPFKKELETIPIYQSAEQIRATVAAVQSKLGLKNSN